MLRLEFAVALIEGYEFSDRDITFESFLKNHEDQIAALVMVNILSLMTLVGKFLLNQFKLQQPIKD